MDWLRWIALAIWFILPAYTANGAPVLLARFVKRRHPIDCGAKFIDGRRILGDSKSIEGFIFGVAIGALTGLLEGFAVGSPWQGAWRGLLLGLGAMIGDCVGSFIKRRIGLESGKPAPLLDQLTFLIFALLLAYVGGTLTISLGQVLFLVVLTPLLHFSTNAIAYKLGLKSVPW
ncbi:MAG: CDP-2,3-bis-(O-geranylgeranyl)-sn-glycerol synthase [Crenarchaeota archaeon]|nr:CDP-2,3-bis-(O-geranylgeranyl)-sn-glycerol synthase [Thermoproteota archaeon]